MRDYNANEVIQVIKDLLGPEGCPWDRRQTPDSLCEYLIEETHELIQAIRSEGIEEVKEELGDVFFLLFFIACLYESNGQFELKEVWQENAAKMIGRHPHVFAQEKIQNIQDIRDNWEKIKKEEKKNNSAKAPKKEGIFGSLPASLPPLVQAYRLNSKAAQKGFTWEQDLEQEDAVKGEWQEWLDALKDSAPEAREEEFGDLLFTLVELGRRKGIKASAALQKANIKFWRRCEMMQKLAARKGQNWEDLDLDGKNRLWNKVKELEKTEKYVTV